MCSNLDVIRIRKASQIRSLGHRLLAGAEEDSKAADPQEREAVEAAVAAQAGSRERPPPWIDVTTALQFMADDGSLVFHAVSADIPPSHSSPHQGSPSVELTVHVSGLGMEAQSVVRREKGSMTGV